MGHVIGIHEAKTHFSQLVKQAANGQPVLIGSYGNAEVALVPASQAQAIKRRIGVMAGKLVVPDDFDVPLPEEILSAFEGTE